ncbi:Nitrogen regulation protein NtrY [hydrothermal vent metagenome]|uniref:histidine kinase n=1 Tax=hydrothermal vent metagenome TaxID=652676 RepID=A0A1W1DRU5_9ZZZZ
MIFNQDFAIKKTPNKWFWSAVFLISLSGLSYLGLNPVLIADWWWVLASYNVIMGCVAIYYIVCAISKLKKDNENGVVGTQFTWSFVKIIPFLVIVPVLSFYLFSFQTIQDNVERSKHTYNNFNKVFLDQVDGLYKGVEVVRNDRYTDHTQILLQQIDNYSKYKKDAQDYMHIMQIFVQGLVDDKWACYIELTNEEDEIIAKSKKNQVCIVEDNQPLADIQPFVLFEDEKTNLFQVQMSTRYLTRRPTIEYMNIVAVYATDPNLLSFLGQVKGFYNFANAIKFNVNTSLTQKSFLLDFSSTVLLTILSVLLIVFRMIDQLMRPMHNLSVASKEIAKGNYDVLVHNQEQSEDMRELIGQFNEMAKQIKASRQGLDTHNLYLETILKYSFGVIGLDKDRNIQLINPVIGKILAIDNEQQFVGGLCRKISDKNAYLEPLFSIAQALFEQESGEWSEEIELTLPDRHVLLSCQGASLDTSGKALGYVIIVKDISKLNRAQKKAAWGEVAVRMAHEIKNPLTPILLSAQRLRNKFLDTLKGKDLEIIDKTTNVIIDQVMSMDAMVSAFADYANTPQIERKPTDLNALINQSIALYDAQSNISIEFDLASDVPELLLDANGISRVLINLVKNSAESVEDSRDLTVSVTTQYLPSEGIVRLSMADNGDGFDEAVIERVFEPYVTTKVKGSGLGMAIVQNIIEQHDGRIFAGNVEPNGAIVTIEFEYTKENV